MISSTPTGPGTNTVQQVEFSNGHNFCLLIVFRHLHESGGCSPMPTIPHSAEVSGDDLLRAVELLTPSDFEQFVARVLAMRAGREVPRLSEPESKLFERINAGLPEKSRQRYEALIARRDARALSEQEHGRTSGASPTRSKPMEAGPSRRPRRTGRPPRSHTHGPYERTRPPGRRSWLSPPSTARVRREVARRARGCCEYCRSQERFAMQPFSVEHVEPRSRQGANST